MEFGRLLFVLLFFSCAQLAGAQQKFTLSGYISDKATGEELIDAKIVVPALNSGAYSNEFGFYSISLPAGTYTVDYRYSGYNTQSKEVVLDQNVKLNIALELNEKVQEIGEVEVVAGLVNTQ